jgi:hypothetical protein
MPFTFNDSFISTYLQEDLANKRLLFVYKECPFKYYLPTYLSTFELLCVTWLAVENRYNLGRYLVDGKE